MRILIYCGPGIGDFILILPMVQNIKASNKESVIDIILTSDSNRVKLTKSLSTVQDYINHVYYYSSKEIIHDIKLVYSLIRNRYDYGFVLQYTDNEYMSLWPYRIIKYAALKTCGINLHHKKVSYTYSINRTNDIHIGEYPLMMLKACGLYKQIESDKPLLDTNKVKKALSSEIKKQIIDKKNIVICLGTANVSGYLGKEKISKPLKKWPTSYWLELSNRFIQDGYQVILIGGGAEEKEIDGVNSILNNSSIINLAGKTSVLESMALICYSKLVIGADTGMMHCSGALGVPCLTLFGCTDHREYLPFGAKSYYIQSDAVCSPCFGTQTALQCNDIHCMKEINVDRVHDKAISILKG